MKQPASSAPALTLFDFQGHAVRTVSAPDSSHWFVAQDITKALGYRDALTGVRSLDADETATHVLRIRSTDGTEQAREVLAVNESGLYALIQRSRKPAAKAFRRWVTSTVLPAIRRHGMYVAGEEQRLPEDMTEEDVRVQMAALQERLQAIEAEKMAAARARHLEHKADRFYALRAMRRRG
jgi:prophage antirepressor-like protein